MFRLLSSSRVMLHAQRLLQALTKTVTDSNKALADELKQHAVVAGTIAFAGTVAYVLSFALGAGPVPGLLVPEINSESLRGVLPC